MKEFDMNKDPLTAILECMVDIMACRLPETDRKEINEMAALRDELTKIVSEPERIPLEKVNRFNELWDKHFAEGDEET